MTSLHVEALRCSRGVSTLFRELSFSVASGEWLAVRGPNGSGKTTLLRCAAGLTRADAGSVSRQGAMLYAGHLPAVKDDLTAEENLRGAMVLAGAPAEDTRIREALAQAGLASRRIVPARRLSAGQRRRIGVARLLLDPAPIWILDEPLTALDDEGQALFGRALARHLERDGLALVATHEDLLPAPARVVRMGA